MDSQLHKIMDNMGTIMKLMNIMHKTTISLAELCRKNNIPIDDKTMSLMIEANELLDRTKLKTA